MLLSNEINNIRHELKGIAKSKYNLKKIHTFYSKLFNTIQIFLRGLLTNLIFSTRIIFNIKSGAIHIETTI